LYSEVTDYETLVKAGFMGGGGNNTTVAKFPID
jgi:hypothetical protein